MSLVLKRSVIEKVLKDPKLFGSIAEELETTVSYGLQLLNKNNPKLTQAGVLRILREGLGLTDDEILEEETDDNINDSRPIKETIH